MCIDTASTTSSAISSLHSRSTKVHQNYYYNEYHGVTLKIATVKADVK